MRRQLDPRIKNRVRLEKVPSIAAAIEKSNALAPEHLELLVAHADRYLPQVHHAGAIFLGSGQPCSDGRLCGRALSHVLPTRGAGHFSSGSVRGDLFEAQQRHRIQGRRSELAQWKAALVMAETEGMENHARFLAPASERPVMKKPLVAIIDYGMGNLRSVQKALEFVGADARVTDSPALLRQARGVVLPGVGAFWGSGASLEIAKIMGARFRMSCPPVHRFWAFASAINCCLIAVKKIPASKGLGFFKGSGGPVPLSQAECEQRCRTWDGTPSP